MNLNDWIFSEPFSDYPVLDAVLLAVIVFCILGATGVLGDFWIPDWEQ